MSALGALPTSRDLAPRATHLIRSKSMGLRRGSEVTRARRPGESAFLGLLTALWICSCASASSGTRGAVPDASARADDPRFVGASAAAASSARRLLPAEFMPEPSFRDGSRVERLKTAFDAERAWFDAQLDALGAPGVAWGVVVDDELFASGARGVTALSAGHPVTINTAFRIASITKVFTAAAVLALLESGRVSLDVPAQKYLPELSRVVYPTTDSPLITLRHLLTHTAGLPRLGNVTYWTDTPPDEAAVLEALDGLTLEHPPGTHHVYSNLGASILGPLIGRIGGLPYRQFVNQRLLSPLGMTRTRWEPEDYPKGQLARPHELDNEQVQQVPEWRQGAAGAAGGLYSTVQDMARWAAFQLTAWPASNRPEKPALRRATLREAQRIHWSNEVRFVSASEAPARARASGAGLGWAVYEDCNFEHVVWHNGASEGHSSALYLLPRRGVGLVLLANRSDADLDSIARELLRRLDDRAALPERMQPLSSLVARRATDALSLGAAFDAEKYEALFEPVFRNIVPAPQAAGLFAYLNATFGKCAIGRPVAVQGPAHGALQLDCDGFDAYLDLDVSLSPPYRIRLMRVLDGRNPKHVEQLSRLKSGPRCSANAEARPRD